MQSFSVNDNKYFNINEKFPKISKTNLKNGISKIRFNIDLSSCQDFITEEKDVMDQING